MLQIADCLIEPTGRNGHWSGDDGSDGTSRPGYDGGFRHGGRRRTGRWPANVLLDGAAAEALDTQGGERQSGSGPQSRTAPKHGSRVYSGRFAGQRITERAENGNTGQASRFFYCQKANNEDRSLCADRSDAGPNEHPCVKPTDLMRWLVRLTTRKQQTVLDPFTGSGSTGVAALMEGRSFLGIEKNPRDAQTARRRLGGRDGRKRP